MTITAGHIRERLEIVRERIAAAAVRSGRAAGEVQLVVVTKGHSVEKIALAIEAGARILGENYADEAWSKIAALKGSSVDWHMIGHIQSRKSRLVAENFSMVHSLDSVKLARRLAQAEPVTRPLPVLIQANVSGETGKFGFPASDPAAWQELDAAIKEIKAFEELKVTGLMTVPPFLPAEQVRPYFRKLAELRNTLQNANPDLQLTELSMGMSGDYEAAVEEGATLVRIGTAILGPR